MTSSGTSWAAAGVGSSNPPTAIASTNAVMSRSSLGQRSIMPNLPTGSLVGSLASRFRRNARPPDGDRPGELASMAIGAAAASG